MSAVLALRNVSKHFGTTTALDRFELEVERGELVTLLGPSGCGKTTLLRIVAGFEQPSAGTVELEGSDITHVPPHRRPVNTVFQRYLLFPHLSVFENIAFGLRVSRCPKREIGTRVREALSLVRLTGFEDRRADQLSGGQAQRISLARALVNRPRILLLDEPLSALDVKVRFEMQAELRRIHRETGTTFLYVTHDQQEAMSLSDRVVVMSVGRIEQAAPPDELYHRPATRFVAEFVGDANLLPLESVTRNGKTTTRIRGTNQDLNVPARTGGPDGWLVLRPEALQLERPPADGLRGIVADVAFLGSSVTYHVNVDGMDVRVRELGREIHARFAVGDPVSIAYDSERCLLLPPEGHLESQREYHWEARQ